MATDIRITPLGLDYVRRFTDAHRLLINNDNPFRQETRCEDVQFPEVLVSPRAEDFLAGKRIYPEIGYSVQYGGLGYYVDFSKWACEHEAQNLEEIERREWVELKSYWEKESTMVRAYDEFPEWLKERCPHTFHTADQLDRCAYPLMRMAGLQLDHEKLLNLGIQGMSELLDERLDATDDAESRQFFEAGLAAIERLRRCAEHYLKEARLIGSEPSTKLVTALEGILDHKPETFHEALQLIQLLTILTATNNFGRLDDVLGPYLCRDLDAGILTWEHALELMQNFYTILDEEFFHTDARIMVGGMGRKNEEQADRFAMLAMETTQSLNLPLPQLTLRFHAGQNPDLLNKAYDVIGQGKTFPMLYNDAVNVPAVEEAFQVDRQTAEQYLPFGCGEYMINHQSCGTPNAIINLQMCLESAINHGRSIETGKRIGPDFGGLESFGDFDAVWEAYDRTIDYFLKPLAEGQHSVYLTTGALCPFVLASLFYDDCISRGRPLFNGGIRYLGGTNETYGNVNAADSLTAIDQLVFKKQLCSGRELLDALKANWKGHEKLRQLAKAEPKYGNDDHQADAMIKKVHDHICTGTSESAKIDGNELHHFLVVIINNDHNTVWGRLTSASPDGRLNGDPLAPGNAPGAGCDHTGLSAALNSQAKPNPRIHAGAVQNVKLSASFPNKNRELYHTLFNTYFDRGGTQAMITVTNRDDLVAAVANPEKYGNLIVRVGGFSARFVDLNEHTQLEILSRTEHG